MKRKIPILLSFHALANEAVTLAFGQLTHTSIRDLTFRDYGRRKTFRTLFRLYHTRPYSNQELILVFDSGEIRTKTNAYGGFYEKKPQGMAGAALQKVVLASGDEVSVVEGLYHTKISTIESDTIVVSDIDDTLLHSYIFRKLKKFRTLMFTAMEKRKAVVHMQELIRVFTNDGAAPVYLSNSEQNLYPMIFRILSHNKFPAGPLFLKQLRSFWDLLRNVKFPPQNTHKINTLEELMTLFPKKQFILMGDNTQHDLQIYLGVAEKFPQNVRYVIIRKVVEKRADAALIESGRKKLAPHNIQIYYSENFPSFLKI